MRVMIAAVNDHSAPRRSQLVGRRMGALEQLRAERKPRRLVQLLVGLVGYGAAVAVLVVSGVGAASWNVLSEGVAAVTGLSFGWASNVIGLGVLLFWIPLRELPGLGTVLNVLLVGMSADLTLAVLPVPHGPAAQWGYLLAGLVGLAFADALYLGARFGSGPRDGLMTGAVRLTGRPVWLVRLVIEGTVVAVGALLGGTLGPGTLVVAVALGPLVQLALRYTTVELARDTPCAPADRGRGG